MKSRAGASRRHTKKPAGAAFPQQGPSQAIARRKTPMPTKQVTGLITDQETIFARLVMSGTMTDRQAAEAAGLNPDSAANTKSEPRVRAYMEEQRAAVEQQLIGEQVDGQRRLKQTRDRILTRLWEIADRDFEQTRGSASAQLKALALIAAIEGLIPNRRAGNKPEQKPVVPNFYQSAWLRAQQNQDANPASAADKQGAAPEHQPAAEPPDAPPPTSEPAPTNPPPTAPLMPRVPGAEFAAPDTRVPFSIKKPFAPLGLNRKR
jgi:hypothetical protein